MLGERKLIYTGSHHTPPQSLPAVKLYRHGDFARGKRTHVDRVTNNLLANRKGLGGGVSLLASPSFHGLCGVSGFFPALYKTDKDKSVFLRP